MLNSARPEVEASRCRMERVSPLKRKGTPLKTFDGTGSAIRAIGDIPYCSYEPIFSK